MRLGWLFRASALGFVASAVTIAASPVRAEAILFRVAFESQPQPTLLPVPNLPRKNARDLGCPSIRPAEIGESAIVIAQKPGWHDFDVIFEKVQRELNRDTGFFNTDVTIDEITIDLKGPVLSSLVPHSPEYYMDAQGSIRFLRALGCNREYIGFTPRISTVRVGVTTALAGSEPRALTDVRDKVHGSIVASLYRYCGPNKLSVSPTGDFITCR